MKILRRAKLFSISSEIPQMHTSGKVILVQSSVTLPGVYIYFSVNETSVESV